MNKLWTSDDVIKYILFGVSCFGIAAIFLQGAGARAPRERAWKRVGSEALQKRIASAQFQVMQIIALEQQEEL